MKRNLLLLFVCVFAQQYLKAQIIFQDNFESYTAGDYNNDLEYNSSTGHGWWQIQNSATSHLIFPQSGCPSITADQHKIVSTGAYAGANCARVFYNTNELWSGNNNSTGCRWRAEFAERLGNDGLATSGSVEVWYGFMIKPMKKNSQQWTKRCMGTTGNDVSCVGLRDNLVTHISQFIADETGAMSVEVDIRHDGLNQVNPRYFDITNIGRTEDVLWNQWNSIIMHVITGNNGLVETWVNGVHYTSGTINLWTATWTHDFKIGIYGDRVEQQAEAYFDNVKFAKGTNQFASVDPTSVLPLHLVCFSGETKNARDNLQWRTENEVNTDHFDLLQSNDGRAFSVVAKIMANAGADSHQYNFFQSSLNNPGGFYRLQMFDKDGRSGYSEIIKLSREGKISLNTFYNSSSNAITILQNAERFLHWKLFSINGSLLKQGALPNHFYKYLEATLKPVYILL